MAEPLPPAVGLLEARLGLPAGTLVDEDLARATAALEDATELALSYVAEPTADAWRLAAPAVVRLVILKAARREYDNPRGLASESLGEHSVGISETSGVYLTAREIALLTSARRAQRARIGSIAITSPFENA
jgi:hypothetical protein